MNIEFNLNKLYYKYINTSIINHYRLLLITEEYIKISKRFFYKYPTAVGWIDLNQKLFETNKQSEIDFITCSKKQNELKTLFFENREQICKNSNVSKDCIVCSKHFQSFYVDSKSHYGQYPQNVMYNIIEDIQNMKP